ncbi:MAG: endonuclease III [Desulfomonilaceae bacterium]
MTLPREERVPDIHKIIAILRREIRSMDIPIVTEISHRSRDPFHVLMTTILSLRTKDEVTRQAAARLLGKAGTPEEILGLSEEEIARLIFPVGFYKTKARTLRQISRDLIGKHGGKVPDDMEELLKLKGVGRKTANLVLTLGFQKPGICVDTHVHRVSNRLGYVNTKTPEQTELALRAKLPKEYWIEYNDLLVTWGQNVCRPISPFCSRCAVLPYCRQVGVVRNR